MRQIANYKKQWLLVPLGLFLFLSAAAAQAYTLEVSLPGMPAEATTNPGVYIQYLFIFGLSLAGFLAVGAIALGGIQYMAAGTSMTSVQKGKDLIVGALAGIVLLLCSWLILNTIGGSGLTNLTPKELTVVDVPKVQGGFDTFNPDDAVTKLTKPPEGQATPTLKTGLEANKDSLNSSNTTVLIDKSDRKMYIYKDGYIIGSTDINIGQAEKNGSETLTGGKQGDQITPIGEFETTTDRRQSENGVYTKDGKSSLGTSFLGISAKDENGNYRGIGIHGSKDDSLRPTNGCIRVKNADSDLLFSSLKPGTKVQIRA